MKLLIYSFISLFILWIMFRKASNKPKDKKLSITTLEDVVALGNYVLIESREESSRPDSALGKDVKVFRSFSNSYISFNRIIRKLTQEGYRIATRAELAKLGITDTDISLRQPVLLKKSGSNLDSSDGFEVYIDRIKSDFKSSTDFFRWRYFQVIGVKKV
jgi:hypothetical protein